VAPEPVSVADEPAQIVVADEEAVTVGFVLTTKLKVVVLIQPRVLVPVTE
jgi:hypothetical protein